jgi:hypothetical protein
MTSAKTDTTVVLVHAAWADGSSWSKVTGALQRKGFNVVAALEAARQTGWHCCRNALRPALPGSGELANIFLFTTSWPRRPSMTRTKAGPALCVLLVLLLISGDLRVIRARINTGDSV